LLIKYKYLEQHQPYPLSALLKVITSNPEIAFMYLHDYYHGKEFASIFYEVNPGVISRAIVVSPANREFLDPFLRPDKPFLVHWDDDNTLLEVHFKLSRGTIQPLDTYLDGG